MITQKDLLDQRELIQNDLQCLLDGLDEALIDNACQIVVDRIQILLDKILTPSKPVET